CGGVDDNLLLGGLSLEGESLLCVLYAFPFLLQTLLRGAVGECLAGQWARCGVSHGAIVPSVRSGATTGPTVVHHAALRPMPAGSLAPTGSGSRAHGTRAVHSCVPNLVSTSSRAASSSASVYEESRVS